MSIQETKRDIWGWFRANSAHLDHKWREIRQIEASWDATIACQNRECDAAPADARIVCRTCHATTYSCRRCLAASRVTYAHGVRCNSCSARAQDLDGLVEVEWIAQ